MATVYLLVKGQKVALDGHQGQFSELVQRTKDVLGALCRRFQYADEDGDLITVESQFDFQEALKFASGKALLLEPVQSPEDRFLEAIPIESSVLFSEQGSLPRDPENQILVSEMVTEEAKSVSSETVPVQRAEKEVSVGGVAMKEEASLAMVEKGEAGTNMDQRAVSCETQPLETKDGSNLAPIVFTATIASGPEPVSTASETAEIQNMDRFVGTDPMIHTSSATPPIEQHEISVQCDELQPPPVPVQPAPLQAFDPNIIKSLIQEEMRGLFPAKRGILRSRVSINSIHQGYSCSLCGMAPIRGARFTCTQCANFNLCEDCEDTNEHEHVLLKIRLPQPLPQAFPPQIPAYPSLSSKPEEAKKPSPIPDPLLSENAIRYPSKKEPNLPPKKEPGFSPKKELSAIEQAQQKNISAIMEMGFDRDQALNALIGNQYDLGAAINSLLG